MLQRSSRGRGGRAAAVGWLVFAVFAAAAAPASALEVGEGWLVRRWAPEDGLPVVGVNALARDDLGYLWLATFDGLVRFDGARFVRAESDLPSPRLTTLWRGAGGALWVSTETGDLGRYDGRRLRRVAAPGGCGDGKLRAIRRGGDGRLLFALGACLYREAEDGLGAARARLDRPSIRSFALAGDGTAWLATMDGALYRLPPGGAAERVAIAGDEAPVVALAPAADGGLWVATPRTLFLRRAGRLAAVALGTARPEILRLEVIGGGRVWAATRDGLYELDPTGAARRLGATRHLTENQPKHLGRPGGPWINLGPTLLHDGVPVLRAGSTIRDAVADPEGNLWLATDRDGLLRLRHSGVTAIDEDDGLPPAPVYPIVEGPRGTVWLGLLGVGVARVQGGVVERLAGEGCRQLVSARTILPEGPDRALVGDRGLWRYRDGRCERVGPSALAATWVRALYRDGAGRLWVGTERQGIFVRDAAGAWEHLRPGRRGLPLAAAQAFLETRDGALWIATAGGGLVRWREGRFEALSRRQGFPSDSVRALWEDPGGALWVGTEDRGLARLRLAPGAPLASAEIAVVGRRRGLPADGVHRILADGRGQLWMSSNQGVFRVAAAELAAVADGRAERVRAVGYTEADGMPAREVNGGSQSAGLVASDGRLWFPTVEGVAVFDPARLPDNPLPPPVVIEALLPVDGDEPLLPPGDGEPLTLGPGERSFHVQYTALSFADPERVRFQVRLEGLTTGWIDSGGQRRMLFPAVPPGKYVLRVRAANEHGVWSPEGAALPIVVVPRWWETAAARGALAVLLVGLVTGAVIRRGSRQRAEQRRLAGLVEERTVELADALQHAVQQAEALREADEAKSRFFAHVAHELRTPLTLLAGPLLDARVDPARLTAEAPEMARAAQTLTRMVEQILDLEKAEAGRLAIDPVPRDLAAIARRVVDGFAGLARSWEVALALEAPAPGPVAAVDAEQIERVLANLVSNALRFTPDGGRVVVRAPAAADGEALLEVADTGQGIPPEALPRVFDRFYQVGFEGFQPGRTRGTGLGLALARELVELHGGRLEVESTPGRGSTFRVRLPASDERPRPLEELALVLPDLAPRPRPAAVSDDADAEDDTRQTVLVVEDHPEIGRSLQRLLGTEYRTLTAPDGAAGLRLARRLLPDLVVADVSMPEMDGFEMARHLAADPATAGIPLLFLTARTALDDELAGFAAGAVAYVRKPFAGDLLRARVASLLRRQRRLAERLREAAAEAGPGGLPMPPESLAERARRAILEHLDDETFGPSELARALAMGRSRLFERLRVELGTTPGALLRAVRVERGRELLAERAGTVSEVAYAVGFTSLAGFSRAYRARYGEPPSATRERASEVRRRA